MITTDELTKWLDQSSERQEHYAALAARDFMPITNHAAAANYAAKCELLRTLINQSHLNDRAVTG